MRKVDYEILELIKKVWEKYPTLRFCQLIGNCFCAGKDFYYVENDDFLGRLKRTYLYDDDEEETNSDEG